MQGRSTDRVAIAILAFGALLLGLAALAEVAFYGEFLHAVAATGNGPSADGPAGTYLSLARSCELLGFAAIGLGGVALVVACLLDARAPRTRRRLLGLQAGLAAMLLFGPFWEIVNSGGPRTSLARELGFAAGLSGSVVALAWPHRGATIAASACAIALGGRAIHAASLPPYWAREAGAWPPHMWLAIWGALIGILVAATLLAVAARGTPAAAHAFREGA